MKTMKKVLCVFLVVLMCVTSAPLGGFVGLELPQWSWKASALASTGQCGDNAYWEFNSSTGELIVTGEGEMWYNHYIYDSQFYGNTSIKKIIIGDDITKIGQMTFAMCGNVKTVVLGKNIEIIDGLAFYQCSSLTDISFPEKLKIIGDSAFLGCSSLSEIIIPESTTEIGSEAFGNCTGLNTLVLPKNLTKIGRNAFYGIPYQTNSANWENGLLYIGSYLVDADVNAIGEACVIKSGTTLIADSIFRYGEFTSITIPDSIKYIGDEAFYSCNIGEIYLPKYVEKIGGQAFSCGLKRIKVSPENPNFANDDSGVLFNKNKTVLIAFPKGSELTTYVMPESVIEVYDFAFDESKLSSIVMSSNVVIVGKYAFSGTDITDITISSKTTTIGDGAFSRCDKLESITIPDSVTYLGGSAFWSCDKLVRAELGSGITALKDQVFERCGMLKEVNIPYAVTEIETMAFNLCGSLKNITLPSGLKIIGYGAFESTDLREITIPASVEIMEEHIFTGCDNLTSVTIKSEYIDLETYALGECAYVYDENNWTDGALYNGKILLDIEEIPETFKIKDGTTCLAKDVFQEYDYDLSYNKSENLKTVYIPSSLKIISYSAFNSCKNLTDVYYDGTQAEWKQIEIRELNNPILKATIHFNDGTTQSHEHNFDTLSSSYLCYYFYKCSCGETTTVFKHVDNNKDQKCDYCGAAIVGHTCEYISEVTKEPTCTEKGEITYTCSCGDSYTETIPLNGHDFKIIDSGKAPTCEEDGYTAKRKCSVCGKEDGGEVIPSGGHDFKIIASGKAPTCEEDGYTAKRKCSICGKEDGGEVIPSDGHIDNNDDKICDVCKENLGEPECTHKETFEQTIPASCTVSGMKFTVCVECGETIGNPEVIPAAHTPGEWETVIEPTYEAEGKKVKKCTVCGETLEEEIIPKLELAVVEDEETGVGLEFPAENYDGVVEIEVKESFDGTAFNILDTKTGAVDKKIYDIKMLVDGEVTQPNGKVKVKLPLPAGYNPKFSYVYYVNTETGAVEKMEATYEDGYMVFETDHFSYYAIIAEPDTDNCSCNCHAGGIKKFFFKFLLFFQKIFRTNKECKCGIKHY